MQNWWQCSRHFTQDISLALICQTWQIFKKHMLMHGVNSGFPIEEPYKATSFSPPMVDLFIIASRGAFHAHSLHSKRQDYHYFGPFPVHI